MHNLVLPRDKKEKYSRSFIQSSKNRAHFYQGTARERDCEVQKLSHESADLSACERGLVLRFTFAFLFRIPPVVISLCNQGEAPPFDSLPRDGGEIREIESAQPEIEPPRTEI